MTNDETNQTNPNPKFPPLRIVLTVQGIRLIDFRATTSGGGSSMIPMGWGRGLVNPLCHHSIGTRETTMNRKKLRTRRNYIDDEDEDGDEEEEEEGAGG